MAMDGRRLSRLDLVHQRVEAARRLVTVPAHVHAGSHAARSGLELDLVPRDDGAPVLAPVLDELGTALLLDVVMRGSGGGLGGHWEPCAVLSRARTIL